jgi:hypothetical protein
LTSGSLCSRGMKSKGSSAVIGMLWTCSVHHGSP